MYKRVKRTDESLDYVKAIREAATVLLIKEDESEVVARIVEGLHPNQRARLVFQAHPTTLQQLEMIVDRNNAIADQMRTPSAGQSTENAVLRLRRSFNQQRTFPVKQTTSTGNQPLCYYCGKTGHFQRNCHLRSSSNFSTSTTARTQS